MHSSESSFWQPLRLLQFSSLGIVAGSCAAIGILFLPWYDYSGTYYNGFGHAIVDGSVDILAPEWQPIVGRIIAAFVLSVLSISVMMVRSRILKPGTHWLTYTGMLAASAALLLLLLVLLTFSSAYNDPEHTLTTHIAFIVALVVAAIGNVGLFFTGYAGSQSQ